MSGASSWSFREDDARLIQSILSGFLGESNARTALIVDRTGQMVATAGEATRRTDREITREMRSLVAAYDRAGVDAVNQSLIERAASERPFLYLLMNKDMKRISGSIEESPVEKFSGPPTWTSFQVTDADVQGHVTRHPARGLQERLTGGQILFVGADIGEDAAYVDKITRALQGPFDYRLPEELRDEGVGVGSMLVPEPAELEITLALGDQAPSFSLSTTASATSLVPTAVGSSRLAFRS